MKTVAELQLQGQAHAGAMKLAALYPGLVFTSGRRGAEDQARAMAGNVVRNRKWIEQTYLANPQSRALQKWVNDHPAADTKDEIKAGLLSVMKDWTDAQKAILSRHFSGQAFDIQPLPPGPQADKVKATIRSLPGLHKFLEREGGLIVWHAQFV